MSECFLAASTYSIAKHRRYYGLRLHCFAIVSEQLILRCIVRENIRPGDPLQMIVLHRSGTTESEIQMIALQLLRDNWIGDPDDCVALLKEQFDPKSRTRIACIEIFGLESRICIAWSERWIWNPELALHVRDNWIWNPELALHVRDNWIWNPELALHVRDNWIWNPELALHVRDNWIWNPELTLHVRDNWI
ncbi:MAG TPA: hypothetical protein V6C76_07785 [Drouetiella sp.]